MTPLERARRLMMENAPYKALALLIALAIWFHVRDQRVEGTFALTLDVQPSADLVVVGDAPPQVSVTVSGTHAGLDRIARDGLVYAVKLAHADPGLNAIHLRPEEVAAGSGVEIVRIAPSTLDVRLEPRAMRKVAVRARVVMDESADWHVKHAVVTPDKVRVSGPASLVSSLDEVWTAPIAADPKDGAPLTVGVPVSLPHAQLKLEDPGPVSVRVEFDKGKAPEEAALADPPQ